MFRYFIISIFLCATAIVANGQDFRLADSLREAGNLSRAAVEYERCHYLATSAAESQMALHSKAECYKQMHCFGQAAATLQRCAESLDDYLQLTLCLYLSGQFEQAVATAEEAILSCNNDSSALSSTQSRIPTDLLLIETLALNEMHCYDSAYAVALRMAATLPPEQADSLRTSIENCYRHTPALKKESTARWLSLCPGAGHLYAGYPVEAVAAFVINAAALGFGIWQLFEHCYITAYIGGAGLLGATWPGSILSAEQHARKSNVQRSARFNRQCREQLLGIR